MNFLDKNGLTTFWEKIKGKTILSETVRNIVIVDEYPEVEEEGVLYLKKGTGSSSESGSGGEETPTLTNLFYQDTDKEYTSSSSGYSCNWSTNKTVVMNSDAGMIKDAQRSSNTFALELKENTTYKLVFTYISGSADGSVDCSLWNETTAIKLVNKKVTAGESGEVTFTATATETITAEMQMYLYTGVYYQNLVYEIGLYEVS